MVYGIIIKWSTFIHQISIKNREGLLLEITFNLKFVTRRYEFWQSKTNITSFISYNSIQYWTGTATTDAGVMFTYPNRISWKFVLMLTEPSTNITILGICCQRLKLKFGSMYFTLVIFYCRIINIYMLYVDCVDVYL